MLVVNDGDEGGSVVDAPERNGGNKVPSPPNAVVDVGWTRPNDPLDIGLRSICGRKSKSNHKFLLTFKPNQMNSFQQDQIQFYWDNLSTE